MAIKIATTKTVSIKKKPLTQEGEVCDPACGTDCMCSACSCRSPQVGLNKLKNVGLPTNVMKKIKR